MSKRKLVKNKSYVYYNSLISIGEIPESGNSKSSKYLVRMENIEQTLILKPCSSPLSEFSDLKESLFFIREIEEEKISYLQKERKLINKYYNYDIDLNNNKEEIMNEKKVNYGQHFILQHMISKKFIYIEKLPNNNYNLKLTSDRNIAVPFSLKRIQEARTSQEFLTFKQSFYINIYIKEKDKYYYINIADEKQQKKSLDYDIDSAILEQTFNNFISNENIVNHDDEFSNENEKKDETKINNDDYSELCIDKSAKTKYLFVNQSWYVNEKEKLFSSQVVNIVFINSNLYKDNNKENQMEEKEEQLMLSAEFLDNTYEEEINDINQGPEDTNSEQNIDINNSNENNDINNNLNQEDNDENKGLNNEMNKKKNRINQQLNQQIKVKLIPYENEFYKHVMKNCFWVIEEESDNKNKIEKIPLKQSNQGCRVKIKNVLLGLYLKVKKKDVGIESIKDNKNINNDNNIISDKKLENEEENEYEFELVDGETLIENSFFCSNFILFYYNMNEESQYMDFKGKYSFRSIFKENNKNDENFDFEEMNNYFQPLSIYIDVEKKYTLLIKNEDDYVFEFKKVDIFEASHVIYIKKIIENLNLFLDKFKNKEIEINNAIKIILLNISFFMNYLLNIEYIFRDENYDINLPIEQRQLILENYGILNSIIKIAEILNQSIKEMNINSRNKEMFNFNNFIKGKDYQYKTMSGKFNLNNSITKGIQKVVRTILEFLKFFSKDNEEIKEKVFLDLDIILGLAENIFITDRSILLNFLFKLIKDSEVIQEYITGGRLNLIFTIKNSRHYNKYAEKEREKKLIRTDTILKYIETSHNYLYYYKKLLTLNKVKHKREEIKKLIQMHMIKVENEYNIKYNYKRNLINIIQKAKNILNKIERPLIVYIIKNMTLLAEKEKKKNLRSAIIPVKKGNNIENKNIKDNKLDSESGFFLNNNLNSEDNYLKQMLKKEKQDKITKSVKNKEGVLKKNNLKRKNMMKEEDNDSHLFKGVFNMVKNLFVTRNKDDNNDNKLKRKDSPKEVKYDEKTRTEKSIENIKLFLSYFENINLNNILFIKENYFNEIFDSLDYAKNSRSKLNYILNGETKSIKLMDGIKLDSESELGQLIPFNIFNKFFPKLSHDDINKILKNDNHINIINEIDEDSENEVLNLQEDPEYLDNNSLINNKSDNNNFLNRKMNQINDKKNDFLSVKNKNNANIINFNNPYNNNKYNINNNNYNIKHSKTNPIDFNPHINKNNLMDGNVMKEIDKKELKKDIDKLNNYLCTLYIIYQFCINQYYGTLHKVMKTLSNYFINYESFCDMDTFKANMIKIRETLISKVAFIKNEVLVTIYNGAKINPTLLDGVFDFENFYETTPIDNENMENNELEESYGAFSINNKEKKIKELSPEEITLIKSLFYFCHKYDKIKYIIDKINYYKKIKNLVVKSPQNQKNSLLRTSETLTSTKIDIMNKSNDQNYSSSSRMEKDDAYVTTFKEILEELYNKKKDILSAYINVHNTKKILTSSIKSQIDTNSKNITNLGYNIDKRINIIVKLLMQYEIDNLFGKLIYLDVNKNSIYLENNILKNIKFVQSNFKDIEKEINKIRIDYDRRGDIIFNLIKNEKNNIMNPINSNNSNFNNIHFQKVNKCLNKMSKNFLNFLNINSKSVNKFKDISKINQMLYKENENFYKKIGFDKTIENLIEIIDCYYDFDKNPMTKLKYCQEILRIFMEIQNIYKNFKELIPEYFKLFFNMIMKSLHTISLYQMNLIENEEERVILKICYYSCESFIIIVFNCKKTFTEISSYMIDILSKLLKIYTKLKNPKNRVIFQILYTYYISRVLLFISKEKYFDDFSYNSFFQIIYPIDKMHDQIISCINEIEKESEEDNLEEEKEEDNDLYSNVTSENENERNNEKSKISQTIINKNNNILEKELPDSSNNKSGFEFYHNNKYYNNYIKTKTLKEIHSNNVTSELKTEKYPQDSYPEKINEMIWENDEEKKIFSFYLNFLSIYVLYLHDRITIKKIMDNSIKNNINIEYDFTNLYSKIEKLLGNNDFQNENIKNKMERMTRHNPNSLLNKIKNDINSYKISYLNHQDSKKHQHRNRYQFESILLESIIRYKYRERKENIEISVKNRELKHKANDFYRNETTGEDKTSSISDKIIKLRTNNLINFYYYDNEFLDLIFLEKICNDIYISENINYYCTNKNFDLNEYNKNEDLLQKILLMKKEFRLMSLYNKGEYNLLHDQYINNDMEEFILLLKTRFTTNDFNRIYSMKKFLYKKINDIYSDDLFNSNYYNNKKMLPFLQQFKLIENNTYKKFSAYNNNIDLYSYLTSLIYIYTKYPKKTCILFYKIGFELLSQKSYEINKKTMTLNNNQEQNYPEFQRASARDTLTKSHTKAQTAEEKEYELDQIIEGLTLIFSRKLNRNIIQNDEVFFPMINSLILFLKEIKENNIYLMKRSELIQKLFKVLDFVFDHLFQDFEKIVNFMKSAESQKLKDKYREKETNLKTIIIFITTILSIEKAGDYNLLTKNIIEFIQNLTGQMIKLILILIEVGKEDSMKTADMLIEFIYYFIEGPNIDNLNSLFTYKFFNLITFIITKIDYYKIFVNNINRNNLHDIIDSYAKIEQKILKIFFVYYNVSYNNHKNISEYLKIREWYEKNYEYIKNKLKKLYYFSKVEMESRQFDIDNALIYTKKDDSYTDEELFQRAGIFNKNEINKTTWEDKLNRILIENNNNNNNENNNFDGTDYKYNNLNENDNYIENFDDNEDNDLNLLYNDSNYNLNKSNYCLIKFDLILIYYTLNLYYKDIINEEYFEVISPTDSFFWSFILFFKQLFFFIIDIITSLYDLIRYLYRQVNEKAKAKVELLQELNQIDTDSQLINEKDMFLDLSSKIKCVEISINLILYKVYFPIINKAKKIEEKTEYYLHVSNDNLPEYISYLITNYDKIHTSVTKNYYFDKLAEIPVLNLMFKNINLFGLILMILGFLTNFLILLSYSDFNSAEDCYCGDEICQEEKKRLYCPHFFFNENSDYIKVKRALNTFGLLQLIFQLMVILDYLSRNFAINWTLSKNNYKAKKARLFHQKSGIEISCMENFKIIFGTILKLINFQSIYYILYVIFIILGYFNHPFFYAFSLLELVNRVEVMLSVLKAMYIPGRYILINLLMFIILEYFFSLFALSIFTSHFPNIKDSKNFLQTFMRMLDQTFKQDGGIGTYLDQSLDPDYVQYSPKAYAGGRFWFDLIFYLTILLIIFQIFTSIIIDYFMTTRSYRNTFSKKSKSMCLICEIEREQLEKIYFNLKDAFKKHTYYCHHIRNYINYLIYVQCLSYRDPIIEEGIWNYHLEGKTSYLPKNTCFNLNEKNILEKIKNKNKEKSSNQ